MIVAKPEFRRQSKRERSGALLTPQLLNKAPVTGSAVREVRGNSDDLIVC